MQLKKLILLILLLGGINFILGQGLIINHNCTNIKQIPENAITTAKNTLHVAYGHTSHGSQLITGMNNLDQFMGGTGLYSWNDGPQEGALDIDDYFMNGDLGNPDRTTWADRTRNYLNDSNNSDVNVVIWSWCGQVSSASESDIDTYLNLMNQLETDFPNVKFVYMTGHLDGSGLTGNLHLRNEQIRNFCSSNNKTLFDFADIECYDPDGRYYGDKIPNDNCDYDSDDNGSRDKNWALEWQNSHTEDEDWYECSSAHSQALNANQKAYAAWWLWASLAGWNGITHIEEAEKLPSIFILNNNYPNPFNPSTNITFEILKTTNTRIDILNILGEHITTLIDQNYNPGIYNTYWNGRDQQGNMVKSGTYIYRMISGNFVDSKKMLLLK